MSDQPSSSLRPLKRMLFQDTVVFSTESAVNFGLIEKVQAAAEAWINANPAIELINIETLSNAGKARTIVWYR